MKKILITAISAFIFQGCYYDKEAILYPSNCDTTNVTYSLTVSPIITNYCLSCHSNSNNSSLGGGTNLEGYDKLKTQAQNGDLLNSIEHNPGLSPMPKNSSKLSDCNILKIKKWIEAGALNN